MFKFTEVGSCQGSVAECFDYDNTKNVTKVVKGTLELFIQVNTGMLLFKMNEFQYGINPNDQVIYEDSDPEFRLVLCLDGQEKNYWIVKLNDNIELIYFCLSERCKLIQRKASRIIIKEIQTQSSSSNSVEEVMVGSEKPQQSTSSLLIEASKGLSKVMKLAGKVLSKGFQKLGSFISQKVQPAQEIEVSSETKQLIQDSIKGSKKVLEFTTQQFAALFRVAKGEAVKMIDKFQKSEKGKQLQEKGQYGFIKNTVKTGIHVLANLYDGFSEGMSEAGVGLAKGTTNVIGAKYGKDAGQASYGVVEGAKNVAGIIKVPKKEAYKMFKQKEEEQQEK